MADLISILLYSFYDEPFWYVQGTVEPHLKDEARWASIYKYLTNRQWFGGVCTLIDNNFCQYYGKILWTHEAQHSAGAVCSPKHKVNGKLHSIR